MSIDASLFGDDEPPRETRDARTPAPVADWQVQLLRKALDARGIIAMQDRQRAIEDAAGRPVDSLRALTGEEAIRVLAKLGESAPMRTASGTTWDERDEDTWIDRL